ncbi:GtrA family protein [Ideonella sp.]|uniref:GtrA family protein n=1 Tax=Ideonella sp. TaxID=1929293 RepID=UPI003BB571A9
MGGSLVFRALMVRQAGVGAICFVLNLGLLWVLVEGLEFSIGAATVTCFFASNFLGHFLSRWLVFSGTPRAYGESLVRYAVIMTFNLALNVFVMHAATHWLGMHYMLASVGMSVAFFAGNFYLHWAWTFAMSGSKSRRN